MQFSKIIGHDEIKQRLIRSVKENRISHNQLFFGPEGTGALPLALAYAQYICCEDKQEHDSCGVCPSCLKYQKLIHPDLHFTFPVAKIRGIDKPTSDDFLKDWREIVTENPYLGLKQWQSKLDLENQQVNITAKDCQEIVNKLTLKTYESEYKIMIIWMVEKINYQAAPKLLKILEEPPEKTLFLLIAEDTEQIIKTILSRAQMIKVPRIPDELIKSELYKIDSTLNIDKAEYLVRMANGSWLELVNSLHSEDNNDLYFNEFTAWMRISWTTDYVKLNEWIDKMSKLGREKLKNFFNYSLELIRECIQINCLNNHNVMLTKEEYEFALKFSKFIHERNCSLISEELEKAIFHIERNGNARIILLDLCCKFTKLLKL